METINFNNIIVKSSRAACDGTSQRRPPTAGVEAMTQDEREQKMEAYNPSQYETITQANNRMSAELSRLKAMTEGGMKLTETDVRVLRTLNGQDGGIAGWGAAVSASIGWLRGAGYAQGYSKIEITDAGRAALQAQEKNDDQ
jgi:hypothetical protein